MGGARQPPVDPSAPVAHRHRHRHRYAPQAVAGILWGGYPPAHHPHVLTGTRLPDLSAGVAPQVRYHKENWNWESEVISFVWFPPLTGSRVNQLNWYNLPVSLPPQFVECSPWVLFDTFSRMRYFQINHAYTNAISVRFVVEVFEVQSDRFDPPVKAFHGGLRFDASESYMLSWIPPSDLGFH